MEVLCLCKLYLKLTIPLIQLEKGIPCLRVKWTTKCVAYPCFMKAPFWVLVDQTVNFKLSSACTSDSLAPTTSNILCLHCGSPSTPLASEVIEGELSVWGRTLVVLVESGFSSCEEEEEERWRPAHWACGEKRVLNGTSEVFSEVLSSPSEVTRLSGDLWRPSPGGWLLPSTSRAVAGIHTCSR